MEVACSTLLDTAGTNDRHLRRGGPGAGALCVCGLNWDFGDSKLPLKFECWIATLLAQVHCER